MEANNETGRLSICGRAGSPGLGNPQPLTPAGLACEAVRQEVAQYLAEAGACPCPCHVAHDGHACGGQSAWAKRQGSLPRCFADNRRRLIPAGRRAGSYPREMADPSSYRLDPAAIPARSVETRTAAFPSSE